MTANFGHLAGLTAQRQRGGGTKCGCGCEGRIMCCDHFWLAGSHCDETDIARGLQERMFLLPEVRGDRSIVTPATVL
jgi:hypothetical protein